MTNEQLKSLEDQIVNCQLLHVAINTIEALRHNKLTNGLQAKWIEEMKEEAGYQVMGHDEDRSFFSENVEGTQH